jgi:hypothetical protein
MQMVAQAFQPVLAQTKACGYLWQIKIGISRTNWPANPDFFTEAKNSGD